MNQNEWTLKLSYIQLAIKNIVQKFLQLVMTIFKDSFQRSFLNKQLTFFFTFHSLTKLKSF